MNIAFSLFLPLVNYRYSDLLDTYARIYYRICSDQREIPVSVICVRPDREINLDKINAFQAIVILVTNKTAVDFTKACIRNYAFEFASIMLFDKYIHY